MADELYPCCQVDENLEPAPEEVPDDAPAGLSCRKCRECGRRHFELAVDPAELGVTLT